MMDASSGQYRLVMSGWVYNEGAPFAWHPRRVGDLSATLDTRHAYSRFSFAACGSTQLTPSEISVEARLHGLSSARGGDRRSFVQSLRGASAVFSQAWSVVSRPDPGILTAGNTFDRHPLQPAIIAGDAARYEHTVRALYLGPCCRAFPVRAGQRDPRLHCERSRGYLQKLWWDGNRHDK